jgi:hypothetical protein
MIVVRNKRSRARLPTGIRRERLEVTYQNDEAPSIIRLLPQPNWPSGWVKKRSRRRNRGRNRPPETASS